MTTTSITIPLAVPRATWSWKTILDEWILQLDRFYRASAQNSLIR